MPSESIKESVLSQYKELSSSIISDALDVLGIHGTINDIVSQVPGTKMCGPAFTVQYSIAESTLERFADFLDDVPEGAICAINNRARTECSVWGDTLSLFAVRHGFAGTIIDGVCRDIDGTRSLSYPMFSRGTFMRTGKNRIGVESTQQPVTLGSVTVHPGDLVFADDTGAVAVPKDRIEEILELAKGIVARDDACVAAIEAGKSIADVWAAGAQAKASLGR